MKSEICIFICKISIQFVPVCSSCLEPFSLKCFIYTHRDFLFKWGMTSIRLPNAHVHTQFKTVIIRSYWFLPFVSLVAPDSLPEDRACWLQKNTLIFLKYFHSTWRLLLPTNPKNFCQGSSRDITALKPRVQLLPVEPQTCGFHFTKYALTAGCFVNFHSILQTQPLT